MCSKVVLESRARLRELSELPGRRCRSLSWEGKWSNSHKVAISQQSLVHRHWMCPIKYAIEKGNLINLIEAVRPQRASQVIFITLLKNLEVVPRKGQWWYGKFKIFKIWMDGNNSTSLQTGQKEPWVECTRCPAAPYWHQLESPWWKGWSFLNKAWCTCSNPS